jgi:DNA polymerase I-like protein with 3'-5' exonuclease and polymerase domains
MLVDTPEKFWLALQRLKEVKGAFVVDTETSGLKPYKKVDPARLCGIAIGSADNGDYDYYFTFRHEEGDNLPLELLQPLRELLADREWLGHNLPFDLHILFADGFKMPPKFKDSIVTAHTANENEPNYKLKELCVTYFGADAAKQETELKAELKRRKAGKESIHKLPASLVAPYALDDLKLTRMLQENRWRECVRWNLAALTEERYEFLMELVKMERRGLPLDVDETHRQLAALGPKIEEYRARLWKLQQEAGFEKPVNLNSPKQLREWLKLDKTNKDYLLELLQAHPEREDLQTLLDYRALFKAESTYFRPFLELIDEYGRLHTTFKVHGTCTWRLSSSEPNLQNSSRDQKDRLYSVRKCFKAPDGWFLVELDYATIEPRLAAHYSADPIMIEQFVQKKDFHTAVARSLFKKQDIDKDERTTGKTFGLSVIYGLGAFRAAKKHGFRHPKNEDGSWCACHESVWAMGADGITQMSCDAVSAEFCTYAGFQYRRNFFEGFPLLEPFMKSVRYRAKQNKYVRIPLFGSVQRFTGRRRDTHKSPNAVIQHSASIMLSRALTRISKLFGDNEDMPRLLLTVHDSIVAAVKFGPNALEQIRVMKTIMEDTTKLKVPVVAEAKIGLNLGNMGDIHV